MSDKNKQGVVLPDFWAGGKTQYTESDIASNPDGGLPDGSVVGRVNTRRNSGSDDFMAQLLQAIVQMQQGRETSAQRAAARRDPTAERNRLSQTPGTPEFNGMGPGGNQMVNGQLLGPITAGSGMTPEQIARMQGPTAMNQWKFPELFKIPRVMPDAPKSDGWVMPGNLGPNTTIFDSQTPSLQPQLKGLTTPPPSPNSAHNDIRGSAQPTPNFARNDIRGRTPKAPKVPFGTDFSAADAALRDSMTPKDFNFFNLPADLVGKPVVPIEELPLAPSRQKKKPGFIMPSFGLETGARRTFGI